MDDIDANSDENNVLQEGLIQGVSHCQGTPIRSYRLVSFPSLIAIKDYVSPSSHDRSFVKYTALPHTMFVGKHKFILRGIVMGNGTHFIAMVLIDNKWLWYDGIGRNGGPALQVFEVDDPGRQTGSYGLTCLYYEIVPLDEEGELQMVQPYVVRDTTIDNNNDDDSANSSDEGIVISNTVYNKLSGTEN